MAARQIVFVANDGTSDSNTATATVTISTEPLPQQEVSGSPDTRRIRAGDTFNFNVQYTTSDNDKTLTGLGLRIHYNSQILDVQQPQLRAARRFRAAASARR